jgi:formylglycine-generating enzyme required for sulfatase activity
MRTGIGMALVGVCVIGLAVGVGYAWKEKTTKEKQAPQGMALIPSGCFNMGDAFSEGKIEELPVHNVCITSDFYMDVHEVTNAEYAACVSGGGCAAPGSSSSLSRGSYYGNPTYNNFPVIYVNWSQATAYCTWAGKRLPTEAEWEYAARGGLSGKRYPWGDTATSCVDANYDFCIVADTSEVGSYPANGYGLYDVGGNVIEWVNDWYLDTYYSTRPNPDNDPPGPASGSYRVLRGGTFYNSAFPLRVSFRAYYDPSDRGFLIGFRCAGD